MTTSTLTAEQTRRYGPHLALKEVGPRGQRRLLEARFLLIGAGALGSAAALYLGAAGAGSLTIADDDTVDLSNLQRQIAHHQRDVGRSKAESAGNAVRDLNPDVRLRILAERVTRRNALELFAEHDVVIDGSDNFATRYLANDAAVLTGRTLVHGSIFRVEGQVTTLVKGAGCYRCLYPEPPPPGLVPPARTAGVFAPLAGVIGAIQATEAIKQVLGRSDGLVNRLLLYDALAMTFREVKWRRNPSCPLCGDHPSIRALIDYERFCGEPAPHRLARA
jgi:adenylyltransferase/sulfurtransferase